VTLFLFDVSPCCKLFGLSCGHFYSIAPTGPSLTPPTASSLRPFAPVDSLRTFSSVQVYHHHPKCFSFSQTEGQVTPSGRRSHIFGSSYAKAAIRLFFHFGGGQSLRSIQFLIFRNPLEIPTARFTNSSRMAFPKISLSFPVLSSRSCCLLLRPRCCWRFSFLSSNVGAA
jgi:hypothetical protein